MRKCTVKDIVCVRDSFPSGCKWSGFGCWCCLVFTCGEANSEEIPWDDSLYEKQKGEGKDDT
jgi:hypothetical protein